MDTRTCRVCGSDISRRHKLAVYCGECAASQEATRKRGGQPAPDRVTECSVCATDISDRHPLASRCESCQAAHRSGRPCRKKRVGERNCTGCGVSIRGYAKGKTQCADCSRPPRWCIDCGQVDLAGQPKMRCDACKEAHEKAQESPEARAGRSAYIRAWQKDNPLKVQFWDRRRCAKEKGLEFTITLEDLEAIWPEDNRCPVCGVIFTREHKSAANGSIDRIDNTRGYVPGNVHIVCVGCNGTKSDLTIRQLTAGHAGPDWKRWARKRLGRPERRVVGAA